MWEGAIITVFAVFYGLGAYLICRQSSAYYEALRCRAAIRLKSNLLCRLLIAPSIKGRKGRLVMVSARNENTITCLGVLSHAVVIPLNLWHLSASVRYWLGFDRNMEAVQKPLTCLTFAMIAVAVASTINCAKVE